MFDIGLHTSLVDKLHASGDRRPMKIHTHTIQSESGARLPRRTFVQGLAIGGVAAGLGLWRPSARAGTSTNLPAALAGTDFDLSIGETPMNFTGAPRLALTVNGVLPGSDPALARGRHGDAAGRQSPARGRLDPLARHSAAGEHGRRAGLELSRHPPGRELPVPVHSSPGGHLLVSQPLGIPGAARPLRPAGHRAARAGAVSLRPRARRDALGLDRRESGAPVRASSRSSRTTTTFNSAPWATSCATCRAEGMEGDARGPRACGARCG